MAMEGGMGMNEMQSLSCRRGSAVEEGPQLALGQLLPYPCSLLAWRGSSPSLAVVQMKELIPPLMCATRNLIAYIMYSQKRGKN